MRPVKLYGSAPVIKTGGIPNEFKVRPKAEISSQNSYFQKSANAWYFVIIRDFLTFLFGKIGNTSFYNSVDLGVNLISTASLGKFVKDAESVVNFPFVTTSTLYLVKILAMVIFDIKNPILHARQFRGPPANIKNQNKP